MRDGSQIGFTRVDSGEWENHRVVAGTTCSTRCCGPLGTCFKKCTTCTHNKATWRISVENANTDEYHAGGVWFNDGGDSRADTQPW
jgi:hypothetical protein